MKHGQNSSEQPDNRADDIESRVDELMAVERDDRHPSNKKKALESIVLEKPNLPMDQEHLEVRVIHPDTPPTEQIDAPEEPAPPPAIEGATTVVATDNTEIVAENDEPTESLTDVLNSKGVVATNQEDQHLEDEVTEEPSAKEANQDHLAASDQPLKQAGLFAASRYVVRWMLRPRQLVFLGIFLLMVVLLVLAVPTYRYASLNALGVRTTASLSVIDNTTDMPLRNVGVILGDQQQRTDDDGRAVFDDLPLGQQSLRIERRAFAEREIDIVLGVRPNDLGEYWLFPTGVQYEFLVTGFVAGVPVAGASVEYDEVSALSNADGVALLTIDVAVDAEDVPIAIVAEGYRSEQRTLSIDNTDRIEVALVPAMQHVYVRPPPGQPDIMAAYLDQAGERVLLEATGMERRDITIVPHPTEHYIAVMTTQDDDRNDDDFLLTTLTIINIKSEATTIIAQSERLQPVGWYGERFVYVAARSGVTGMDTRRHQLMSYHRDTERTDTLASGNYFNAILPTEQYIYYAPSSIFMEESTSLRRVAADGSVDEPATSQEAWSVYRHDFTTFIFATNSQWFEYDMTTGDVIERTDELTTITSRLYRQNPVQDDWFVTSRTDDNNQREILFYDVTKDEYKTVVKSDTIRHPVHWLHESIIVYRVEADEQLVDYVHHIDTGLSRELWPVGASSSLERWYSF